MVADDTKAIRESLAELVRSDPSLELVGTARDAAEAIELARTSRPKVALAEQAARIRGVVSQGLMRMVLQPIVNLETGRLCGAEALARFALEPVRSPDQWFQEAERVGLSAELEGAAVRAALATLELLG